LSSTDCQAYPKKEDTIPQAETTTTLPPPPPTTSLPPPLLIPLPLQMPTELLDQAQPTMSPLDQEPEEDRLFTPPQLLEEETPLTTEATKRSTLSMLQAELTEEAESTEESLRPPLTLENK